MSGGQTPSQTVGPFFAYGLTAPQYGYDFDGIASDRLADEQVAGERIRIVGRVLDGAGEPIPDAMIEIWQADSEGRYAHSADPRGPIRAFAASDVSAPARMPSAASFSTRSSQAPWTAAKRGI